MADGLPGPPLFESTWGDILLFVSSIEWEAGNTVVVHDLSSGDDHPTQFRGAHIHTSTLQLLFDGFTGVSGASEFRRFEATLKERRIFTHPMDGSYFARIGSCRGTVDENSVVRASVEFIPDGVVTPVSPAGAGTTGTSGESSVGQAADDVDQVLSDTGIGLPPAKIKGIDFTKGIGVNIAASFGVSVGVSVGVSANVSASAVLDIGIGVTTSRSLSARKAATASAFAFATVYSNALAAAQATSIASDSGMGSPAAFAFAYAAAAVGADARATVASWNQEENLSIRQVQIDASRLSDSIAQMIEVGGFELELQLHPAFLAAIMLGESVRSAAIAATSDTPAVFVMRIQHPTALLPLAAKIYGGAAAQDRAAQIVSLNDIRTPAWLDPGSYLMPARPPGSAPVIPGSL